MRYPLLLLSLLLTLTACKAIDTRSEERKLEATLNSYATAVRWQPPAAAYSFLEPELQPEALPGTLDNVRVTGYEITAAPREVAEGKVVQTAHIEYVLIDRQSLHSLVDSQLWQRNADGEWQRANPIPAYK